MLLYDWPCQKLFMSRGWARASGFLIFCDELLTTEKSWKEGNCVNVSSYSA